MFSADENLLKVLTNLVLCIYLIKRLFNPKIILTLKIAHIKYIAV